MLLVRVFKLRLLTVLRVKVFKPATYYVARWLNVLLVRVFKPATAYVAGL
jgi:hypothetical protein